MTSGFESALRQLLKEVVYEVANDLMQEWKASARQQSPPSTLADDSFLLTARETAKRLAISQRHLHTLAHSGHLPCVRVGKCVRYNVETIQKWVRDSESAKQPSASDRYAPEKASAVPKPKPTTSPRPRPQLAEGRRRRSPDREKTPAPEGKSPKVPQPISKGRPQQVRNEERTRPFSLLLSEIGIERNSLPPITNGDLMRIAEVDIPTMHGWLHLNRSLPEVAMNRLRNHFCRFVKERQDGK